MIRQPKVNEAPFHHHLGLEAIRILRPHNCGIDDTRDRFTLISLVVDYPKKHDCVMGLLMGDTLILQHVGGEQKHYRLFGGLHERAIEVAYRMMRMARAVVPQGGKK